MIALNFLPAVTRSFRFSAFRSIAPLSNDEKAPLDTSVFRLPENLALGAAKELDWHPWALCFSEREGFEKVDIASGLNSSLTIRALSNYLRCKIKILGMLSLSESRERYYSNRLYFQVEEIYNGCREIWIEPYFLKRANNFGLLCGFRFRLADQVAYSPESQKGSFSLDESGRANRSKLVDTADFLGRFLKENPDLITSLSLGNGEEVSFERKFLMLDPIALPPPAFSAGGGKTGSSAFSLINQVGPVHPVEQSPKISFCFEEQDRELSRRVYRGLRGELPGGFRGTQAVYGLELSTENTIGKLIPKWDSESLALIAAQVAETNKDCVPIAVVILPKDADDDDQLYWRVKAEFLRNDVHSQLIRRQTITNPRTFEFSLPNLALNVFAKCGGTPWLSASTGPASLVIGVSQSSEKNANGELSRVFGFAVITDTTGAFHGMKFLSDSKRDSNYGESLQHRLTEAIRSFEGYSRCVIHASFELKREQLRLLQEVGGNLTNDKFEVVALQLSEKHKFIGFDKERPLFVPADGTLLQLSRDEALAWLVSVSQGAGGGRPNHPLLGKLLYPTGPRADELTRCLREAARLSGLSWRSFRQSSMPVSILYAERISSALLHCPELKDILAEKEFDWPWFI